jgi:RyR domain
LTGHSRSDRVFDSGAVRGEGRDLPWDRTTAGGLVRFSQSMEITNPVAKVSSRCGAPPASNKETAVTYVPSPLSTDGVEVPPELLELRERLAENAHELWAKQRMTDGWRLGPRRDDARKEHPCLVPYSELPEAERDYDRLLAMETIKTILALGFRVVPPDRGEGRGR